MIDKQNMAKKTTKSKKRKVSHVEEPAKQPVAEQVETKIPSESEPESVESENESEQDPDEREQVPHKACRLSRNLRLQSRTTIGSGTITWPC